jgi:hypothetical protein
MHLFQINIIQALNTQCRAPASVFAANKCITAYHARWGCDQLIDLSDLNLHLVQTYIMRSTRAVCGVQQQEFPCTATSKICQLARHALSFLCLPAHNAAKMSARHRLCSDFHRRGDDVHAWATLIDAITR